MSGNIAQGNGAGIAPHERYAMIVDIAYELGEERRRRSGAYDPQLDWLEAEAAVNSRIENE